MKPGDLVVNSSGWCGELVSRRNAAGNVLVLWKSGPIKGREGRVASRTLKPAAKKKVRVLRLGEEISL